MGLAHEPGIDAVSALPFDLVAAAYFGAGEPSSETLAVDSGQPAPDYTKVLVMIRRGSQFGMGLPGVEYIE